MAYTRKDLTKDKYTTGDLAKLFNTSPKTIQSWDRRGTLKLSRTVTGRRTINVDDLIVFLKEKNLYYEIENENKRDVIYARVSTLRQVQQGDLDRQVAFIIESVDDLKNPLILKEQGSGLNDQRKKLLELIDLILQDKVNRIFITYKERLTRFGFNFIQKICDQHNVEIVILQNNEEKSIEQELSEDIICLLASFSDKLYGMRSHKNSTKRKGLLENE